MNQQMYVWDRFVRTFHWSLVGLVCLSYLTGEEEHWLHTYSGYAIFTLISLRVIWGFIGSEHARFADFVYSPGAIARYIGSLTSASPKHYLGHNPAGGIMVIALLLALFATTLSGMKLLAVEEGKGPFAGQLTTIHRAYADSGDDKDNDQTGEEHEGEEFWEEVHEASVNILLLLVATHLVGVVLSSWRHKENLVKAMITGNKNSSDQVLRHQRSGQKRAGPNKNQ